MAEGDEGQDGSREPRAVRSNFFLMTDLQDSSGQVLGKARVRNISSTGMMVQAGLDLVIGMELRFSLRGIGDVSGTVARIHGEDVGIRFNRVVDPELARQPVAATPRLAAKPQLFRI